MCDNQNSIHFVHNLVHHNHTKHIRIRYIFIHEKQEDGEIDWLLRYSMLLLLTDIGYATYLETNSGQRC